MREQFESDHCAVATRSFLVNMEKFKLDQVIYYFRNAIQWDWMCSSPKPKVNKSSCPVQTRCLNRCDTQASPSRGRAAHKVNLINMGCFLILFFFNLCSLFGVLMLIFRSAPLRWWSSSPVSCISFSISTDVASQKRDITAFLYKVTLSLMYFKCMQFFHSECVDDDWER